MALVARGEKEIVDIDVKGWLDNIAIKYIMIRSYILADTMPGTAYRQIGVCNNQGGALPHSHIAGCICSYLPATKYYCALEPAITT